ncbi:MAG: DoxX family protein [bacterium]|nr:DoxX family protein [bacterium]
MVATVEILDGLTRLLLGFVFMNAGGLKFGLDKAALAREAGTWVDEMPPYGLRMLGALEMMAGFGVILPLIVDLPRLVVTAGAGLMVMVMAGAMVVHGRRGEVWRMVLNIVLAGMALFVLVTRPGW